VNRLIFHTMLLGGAALAAVLNALEKTGRR
jgi:hypothetical protein